MKTQEEVLNLLVALGSDEKEVVNKLMSLGIKGNRRKCRSCPITKYLISNGVEVGVGVGVALGVAVAVGAAVGVAVGVGVEVEYYYFPLCNYPQFKGIRDFIRDFDNGEYPQLEV